MGLHHGSIRLTHKIVVLSLPLSHAPVGVMLIKTEFTVAHHHCLVVVSLLPDSMVPLIEELSSGESGVGRLMPIDCDVDDGFIV